jgi:type IV fimbrial biogenesis protein FimT
VIELMITLAILAVITSLALPSYLTILEKRRITSGAEQVGAFLAAVQMEAVQRNEPITVSYSRATTDSWCIGLTAAAQSCDCTADVGDAQACTVDGALRVFRSSNLNFPGIMSAMTGDGAFVFDPVRGLLVDPADTASLHLLSSTGLYALDVEIIATGRVRICSADPDSRVPGYAEC